MLWEMQRKILFYLPTVSWRHYVRINLMVTLMAGRFILNHFLDQKQMSWTIIQYLFWKSINTTLLQIHVGINNHLKGMPSNVTVDTICNDILETTNNNIVAVITMLVRCLFQVLFTVPKWAMSYHSSWMICFIADI